jgi:hypothetical protein
LAARSIAILSLPSKIQCSSKFSLTHLEIESRGDKVLLSPASARPRMGKPQGDKLWILLQATTLPRAASAFFRSFPRYSNLVPHISPQDFPAGLFVCLFVCLFGGSFVVGLGTGWVPEYGRSQLPTSYFRRFQSKNYLSQTVYPLLNSKIAHQPSWLAIDH